MRIYANRFLAILASVTLLFVAVLAAACTDPNSADPTDSTVYTVTAEYDETKGAVSLSKTSASEGELITVSVTAKEGFEVNKVTVNDAGVILTDGKYTFAIYENTVVKATFKAASEDGGENGDITISLALSGYAWEKGSITVSDPVGDTYRVGEEVTITVTPNAGYDVGSVTINGVPVTLTNGAYTFTPQEDITIKVTFHLAESELPVVTAYNDNVEIPDFRFGYLFRSSWMSIDGETPIYIGTNKLCVGDDAIPSVTPSGTDGEQSYAFTIGSVNYTLSWLNFNYTQGYVLHLLNHATGESEYFVKDPLPVVKIEDHFNGKWVKETGRTKLVITDDQIIFDGKTAEAIVDVGYKEFAEDQYHSPLHSHMYYFFIEGKAYQLCWYPDGSNPTVDTHPYIEDVERTYTFAEEFRGTWVSLDGGITIEIGETSLTVNGVPYVVDGYSAGVFMLEWYGLEYEVQIAIESKYVLQLTHYTYDENGIISGSPSYVYFVSVDLPAVTVNAALHGTWEFSSGNDNSGNNILAADPIYIGTDGIFWGDDPAVVISGETRSDGFVYVIAVRDMICTLSYLDQSTDGSPNWVFELWTTDGHYEFVNNA